MADLIQQTTVHTPLGIRFWDPVLDAQVRDGLTVTARPNGSRGFVRTAFRTGSGIYAFQDLPGLAALELPYTEEDGTSSSSSVSPRTFILEVSDRLGRFLPTTFTLDLPLEYEGVYPTDNPATPSSDRPAGFYLFSAPTRAVPSGLAVLRAQLIDQSSNEAAAFAVLEVQIEDGDTWYGIADERGSIAILFPYPGIRNVLGLSPPGIPGPLSEHHWNLAIRVRYEPAALEYPTDADLPDLRSIFDQAVGSIWTTGVGPPVDEWSTQLNYGQELVMRTDALSTLLVTQGTSSP